MRKFRILAALAATVLAGGLAGCAATPQYLKDMPAPIRQQAKGLLSGRLDPWRTPSALWATDPKTDPYWSSFIVDGWAPLYDAEKRDERLMILGQNTPCRSHRVMTLDLLHSPRYWTLTTEGMEGFLPARDRVYAKIKRLRVIEQTIKFGSAPVTAQARVARRDAFAQRPYVADFKPTPDDQFLDHALMIERCRVITDNNVWIMVALTGGTLLVPSADPITVAAAFALLIDNVESRDVVNTWLPKFIPFAVAGKLDRVALARSIDNYAVGTGQPQVYGSFQTCRGAYDRSKVHAEGPTVAREDVVRNRATLGLPDLETVEKPTRDACMRTYPFSM